MNTLIVAAAALEIVAAAALIITIRVAVRQRPRAAYVPSHGRHVAPARIPAAPSADLATLARVRDKLRDLPPAVTP